MTTAAVPTRDSRCAISDAKAAERESDDPAPALQQAASAARLAHDPSTLIRYGSNAVFRLPDEVIARVSRPGVPVDGAARQVAVARWLESVDFPAARVIDVEQPIEADGRVVTFWKSAADDERYAEIDDVAALIRDLHQLAAPAELELPALRPFGDPDDAVPLFPGLAEADESFLRERYSWARKTLPGLPFALPRGVIHGDANVGNVILDRDDRPVLIDLDSFATGPREWDLIQTALFADRLGWHSPEEYRRFVDVYGHDLRDWEGYEQLADMREIAMTAWLSKQAAHSEKSAAEAAKRIAAIRTGASRRDWSAY
ncbi:phosphotransferase family protein [Pseudonocardia parietis]|uniref:Aminoglycoside phosphotransferase (APT) family kinase protein n=1 Tax=Pseudonocardia parietis TaxID=570936 RepID=A0ABS4W137_9PSEU|nr:aminoglycoside phosphotransferase family protein [Pseudonocardia parietis]MBP2369920.1 aminoglycoside phosphotransferase (APT) family kinase protein [Pseudonocardia parietis]